MDQAHRTNNERPLTRWLYVLVGLALFCGLMLRFTHLGAKFFVGEEAQTAMHVSGYTQSQFTSLYDGKMHTMADVQRLQHLAPHYSVRDTVHLFSANDPQQPPLYSVAERLWANIVGDQPAQLRLFAALISLISFPALFWLCRELFADDRVGWVAIALLAVSPFHLLYAHEASEYSLWTATTLLVSAALLRAVRCNTLSAWFWYAAAIAISMYTDLLSSYVLLGHAIWVTATLYQQRQILVHFAASYLIGLMAFCVATPRLSSDWHTVAAIATSSSSFTLESILQKWIFNTGAVLFDAEYIQLHFAIIASLAIILLFVAVMQLARTAPSRSIAFLAALGGVFAFGIIAQDIAAGTHYSLEARYLTPLWLSLEICLAYAFVRWLNDRRSYLRDVAELGLVSVLALGTLSSYVNGRAPAWWNTNVSADTHLLAAVINSEERPLLISSYHPDTLLMLSQQLRPDIHILLVADAMPSSLPTGFGNYDVLSPTQQQEQQLTQSGMFNVAKREDFADAAKVHHALRPSEFLIHLTGPGAFDNDLPFRKALPSRLAYVASSSSPSE